MAGSFEFIDNTASLQGKSRKLIRSHVMKGKNAGKVRPKRRQLVASRYGNSLDGAQLEKTPWAGPKISIQLLSRVCGEMASVSFPCVMTPQTAVLFREFMRYVSESMYPPEFCLEMDAMRSIWFQYILRDEAYFHCFMAMASVCIDFVNGGDIASLGDRRHISKALRLLNHRLSGHDATSDINIAGVQALCILASTKADAAHLEVHFQGLRRMIDLRGGIENLYYNYALVEKAHRIDIDLALRSGCQARLQRVNRPTAEIFPSLAASDQISGPFFDVLQVIAPELAQESREMMKMAAVLNSGTLTEKINSTAFEDSVMSLCYKLIDINTISGPRLDDPLSDALHLTQLAFMSTLLVQFGFDRRFQYRILAETYMMAMDHPGFLNTVDPATHFWLLAVGSVAVLEERDQNWLLPKVTTTVNQLEIHNWAGASSLLRRYPWVNVLHDRRAMQLWYLCYENQVPGLPTVSPEPRITSAT